jgi:hypothetical protein
MPSIHPTLEEERHLDYGHLWVVLRLLQLRAPARDLLSNPRKEHALEPAELLRSLKDDLGHGIPVYAVARENLLSEALNQQVTHLRLIQYLVYDVVGGEHCGAQPSTSLEGL